MTDPIIEMWQCQNCLHLRRSISGPSICSSCHQEDVVWRKMRPSYIGELFNKDLKEALERSEAVSNQWRETSLGQTRAESELKSKLAEKDKEIDRLRTVRDNFSKLALARSVEVREWRDRAFAAEGCVKAAEDAVRQLTEKAVNPSVSCVAKGISWTDPIPETPIMRPIAELIPGPMSPDEARGWLNGIRYANEMWRPTPPPEGKVYGKSPAEAAWKDMWAFNSANLDLMMKKATTAEIQKKPKKAKKSKKRKIKPRRRK